jgi:ribose 5-phosphate isomerase A
MDRNELKELAAYRAIDTLVQDGMKLGLGTGSTAIHAVRRVGFLLREGRLRGIRAVATSFQTAIECEKQGIPLFTLNSPAIDGALDLCVDGADEVDPRGRCVKGGGGALLIEKIVAYASASLALVVDASKLVEHLAQRFPVPVEVVAEARVPVTQALQALGAEVVLREAVRKAGPVITDHGNLLLDARFRSPIDPAALELALNRLPGLLENGFFTRKRPTVFIARVDGTVEIRAYKE